MGFRSRALVKSPKPLFQADFKAVSHCNFISQLFVLTDLL